MFFPITNKTFFSILQEATRQARKKDGHKLPCFTRILIELRTNASPETKDVHGDDVAERISELTKDGHLKQINHKGYVGFKIISIPEDDDKKLTKKKLFTFLQKVTNRNVLADISEAYDGRVIGELKFNNYFGYSWVERSELINYKRLSFEDRYKVGGFLRSLFKEGKIYEMLWENSVLYRPVKPIDWTPMPAEEIKETKYQADSREDVYNFVKQGRRSLFGWTWVEHEDITTGAKKQVESWLQELVDDYRLAKLKYKSRIYYKTI